MDSSVSLVIYSLSVLINILHKSIVDARLLNLDIPAPAPSPISCEVETSGTTFNVVDYGAYGDGQTDDSGAFLKAWAAACGASGVTPSFIVPSGKTFFLKPIDFAGPCKAPNIIVQIQGNIVAPNTFDGWTGCKSNSWISFTDMQGLKLNGSGRLDGQGSLWWNASNLPTQVPCLPSTALQFASCQGLQVKGINSINSPKNHISISDSDNADISNIHLQAPENSPNTDGIDIARSSHIYVHDSIIATGDDCMAINGGSSFINVTRVTCGPGHGISVGSLGAKGASETVNDVHVFNCTFTGTKNGARIKTWPGGSGYATNITFESIIIDNVENPIIIDQHYCNGQPLKCPGDPSQVKVTNVIYRSFNGTSASKIAIKLDCSEKVSCNNLEFDDINFIPAPSVDHVQAYCNNAIGMIDSPSVPSLDCLKSSIV
ncbi:hypothetical protein Droror1_Dr00002744 [Drosera rotundifolia]